MRVRVRVRVVKEGGLEVADEQGVVEEMISTRRQTHGRRIVQSWNASVPKEQSRLRKRIN